MLRCCGAGQRARITGRVRCYCARTGHSIRRTDRERGGRGVERAARLLLVLGQPRVLGSLARKASACLGARCAWAVQRIPEDGPAGCSWPGGLAQRGAGERRGRRGWRGRSKREERAWLCSDYDPQGEGNECAMQCATTTTPRLTVHPKTLSPPGVAPARRREQRELELVRSRA